MLLARVPVLLAAAAAAAAAAAVSTISAASPLVRWTGRALSDANGSVFFDWEGVSAEVVLSGASFVTVDIVDACGGTAVGGGSRWDVHLTSDDPKAAPPFHKIQTFFSGPRVREYYLWANPGSRCDPGCSLAGQVTLRLTRATESRLSGCSASGGNMSVAAFTSDGVFQPPLPAAARRLEFIGDSISAGDLNQGDGAAVCANGAFNNDILSSVGGLLCSPAGVGNGSGWGGSVDCTYTAWGGITLGGGGGSWGMADLYPFTFSAAGRDAYTPWAFPPPAAGGEAVVINLGTNDRPAPPAWAWIDRYVRCGFLACDPPFFPAFYRGPGS